MSKLEDVARKLHKAISMRSCANGEGDCIDTMARCYCLDEQNYILAALTAAVEAERAACEAIARKRSEPTTECERLTYDGSCNAWECASEVCGKDCLCIERQEEAEYIADAIAKRKTAEKDESPLL